MYAVQAKISGNRHQREWTEYIEHYWSAGINWEAKNLVYQIKFPFSRWEYIGETSIGFKKRIMTHIQQTYRRAGRQKLYRKLRGYGIHHGIFFPVVTWEGNTTKFARMREEA